MAGPAEQHSLGPGQATAWFAGGGLPGSVPATGGELGVKFCLGWYMWVQGLVAASHRPCQDLHQEVSPLLSHWLRRQVWLGPFIIGEVDEELTAGEGRGPPCFGLTLTCSCPGAPLSHPD